MKRHWAGHIYYYAAALIGLGLVAGGAVGVFRGLSQAALPTAAPDFRWRAQEPLQRFHEPDGKPSEPSEEELEAAESAARDQIRDEGLFGALQGVGFVVVGAPVFVWHIRRARAREDEEPPSSE